MGLDMYLVGDKFLPTDWKNDKNNLKEDGFRVKSKLLELGYWRKHPNLHGYIVQEFADGVDECQKIELDIKDLSKLLDAVKEDGLPETSGFFFGASSEEDRKPTIEMLEAAISWLGERDGSYKSVYYEASW